MICVLSVDVRMSNKHKKKPVPKLTTVDQSNSFFLKEEGKDKDLVPLLSVIFEQIRLQQEVRDRWFEHYISIIGAIAALATLFFSFLHNTVSQSVLFHFLGGIFLFAYILGVCFYLLYIKQRQNYRKTYREFNKIQEMIFERYINPNKKSEIDYSIKIRKFGADFITIIIENILCSACLALAGLFVGIGYSLKKIYLIIILISLFVISLTVLYIIYRKWEKK